MENVVSSHTSETAVPSALAAGDSLYVVLPTGEVLRLSVFASSLSWRQTIACALGNERANHGATP